MSPLGSSRVLAAGFVLALVSTIVFLALWVSERSRPAKEVVQTVEVIKEVPKEVIKEVPKEVIREVVKEIPKEVIKEVTVTKEVPAKRTMDEELWLEIGKRYVSAKALTKLQRTA